jgi:hypothetical protein
LRVRKGGERETEGEGGEKGEEIQRERKLEYRRQRQQHQIHTIAGRSSRRSDMRGVVCGSGLGVCNSATGGGK